MRRYELAERVIELRERAELTQGEAAQKAGVGVTTWSNIETGTITRPHARTVIKIARALGVEPEELTAPKAIAPPSPEPERVSEEERRIPTAKEMDEVTAVLVRLVTQRLATINRWREIGVDALEEATCGWFDMDMANDQIFRELQEHGTDEVINNRQNARAEDLKAALRQTDAFGSLLGIAADARNVVGELSEQATKEGVRTVEAIEDLLMATRDKRDS